VKKERDVQGYMGDGWRLKESTEVWLPEIFGPVLEIFPLLFF